MADFCLEMWGFLHGGHVAGGQNINGGTHKGGHEHYYGSLDEEMCSVFGNTKEIFVA